MLHTLDSGPYSRVYGTAMTKPLHLPARSVEPIACDMSTAPDRPDERLAEYGRLFERALLRRERRADALVFAFRAHPGTREVVDDLVRREAACCPFLDYRVETVGDEVIWEMINPAAGDQRASVEAILDAFHNLPEHGSSVVSLMASRPGPAG
jgi:hypothetical protein